MSLANFYLLCFVAGLALSAVSLLGSVGRVPFLRHHLRHHVKLTRGTGGGRVPFFNLTTDMVFLAWFGGAGYLLSRTTSLWLAATLMLAVAVGLAGAGVVFIFLVRVLMAHESALDPLDFDLVGVLGRVNAPARPGGTGEMVFAQGGSRRVTGVRHESGEALAKGVEVVVTRYDKGIAYVRRWEDAMQAGSQQSVLKK